MPTLDPKQTLGVAAPAYAQQEQHDQQEEQKAKPAQDEKKAQPAKQREKSAEQDKNTGFVICLANTR